MRIAVIETAPFGGLLHYAVQLGDALAERGDDVELIVPEGNELAARPGRAVRREVLPRGPAARASETRLSRPIRRARSALWRVAVWMKIVTVVRRGRYDAVILNGSIDISLSALGALALVRLSGNTVVTHVCHNVRPYNRWGGSELFVSSRSLLGLLGRVYPAFDLVFVHGEQSRQEFERTWPPTPLATIPHGDEGIFAAEPPPPAGEPRILFFGDWRKVKGLSVLMAAFDELATRMPEARLTVAGSPSSEEGEDELVRGWAARYPERVELIPRYVPVEEVAELFGRARVVVLPYLVGYQSGVLHLAMTMARAVVVSDVGDLGSVAIDGETGRVVTPGDAAELAGALQEVLADPELATAMGDAGARRIAGTASWDAVAGLVQDALGPLLPGGPSR